MGEPINKKPTSDDWPPADGGESGESIGSTTRDWLAQLQSMIDNAATQARPVLRQVAAKAAELAAVAGEKAGPIAHKAAEVTAQAGSKVAERGREVAADLRRDSGDGTTEEPVAPIEAVEPGVDASATPTEPPAATDETTST